MTPRNSTSAWETKLAARAILRTRPERLISVKRDVHVLEINASAASFADAFHRTMRAPGTRFGVLEVRRPADRRDQPFRLGDRFQGRFNLASLLGNFDRALGGMVRRTVQQHTMRRVLDLAADQVASDYGIVDLLDLEGALVEGTPTYRFRYRYLEGSPIAGSSSFVVQPCKAGCRLTQVFEYQELRVDSAALFSVVGVKIHNRVLYEQVRQSADAIGARIVRTDIPESYFTEDQRAQR